MFYFLRSSIREEVRFIFEDYLGPQASIKAESNWLEGTFGKSSHPFQRITTASIPQPERFVEVRIGLKSLAVITRQADEFTNNVAQGFAELLARHYKGTIDSQ